MTSVSIVDIHRSVVARIIEDLAMLTRLNCLYNPAVSRFFYVISTTKNRKIDD